MNIYISGGAKNGKSYYAQEIARQMSISKAVPLYYIATMIPHDEEDEARIKRHIKEREGWGFETIEQGVNILDALNTYTTEGKPVSPKGVFLLDSVTALLSNEMFPYKKDMDLSCSNRVLEELKEFLSRTGNVVLVSDYIYSDANEFEELTDIYIRGLALLDRELAKICEQVIEVSFGHKYFYKDEESINDPFKEELAKI